MLLLFDSALLSLCFLFSLSTLIFLDAKLFELCLSEGLRPEGNFLDAVLWVAHDSVLTEVALDLLDGSHELLGEGLVHVELGSLFGSEFNLNMDLFLLRSTLGRGFGLFDMLFLFLFWRFKGRIWASEFEFLHHKLAHFAAGGAVAGECVHIGQVLEGTDAIVPGEVLG